jgi:hypothetical protein
MAGYWANLKVDLSELRTVIQMAECLAVQSAPPTAETRDSRKDVKLVLKKVELTA